MSDTDATARFEATVTGHVQGVGFRISTAREARRLGLAGWVANAPDGTVRVAAEGGEEALEHLVAYLQVGPRAARVRRVDVSWSAPHGHGGLFEIR